jgi:pantetheine-phosphate adenylyltransferase
MTVAIYAGSFDPFTTGHLFVARRAASLFDYVVVLVGDNPRKTTTFTSAERLRMIRSATRRLPNVRADLTHGMVVEYARDVGATVLVRGIRDAADAQSESALAEMNWSLAPEIATILLPAPPDLREVSSTEAKARALAGDALDPLLSPEIARRLRTRLGGQS